MTLRLLPVTLFAFGCATTPAPQAGAAEAEQARLAALVSSLDRSEADRQLDPGRKPVEFLKFVEARPGMKVGEVLAGGGYTTELLARAVAPDGVVYGHNTPAMLQRFLEKPWSTRLGKPQLKNVIRVDRELDSPFPPEVTDLDLVVSNAAYHDTVAMMPDRFTMNTAIYSALRPGGAYVVCDSSAVAGTGDEHVATLHRIDEQFVRDEVTVVGFTVGEQSDILRNPNDARDWNASPPAAEAAKRRGQSDRFCLKFIRP